jgi:hypothetical protein
MVGAGCWFLLSLNSFCFSPVFFLLLQIFTFSQTPSRLRHIPFCHRQTPCSKRQKVSSGIICALCQSSSEREMGLSLAKSVSCCEKGETAGC